MTDKNTQPPSWGQPGVRAYVAIGAAALVLLALILAERASLSIGIIVLLAGLIGSMLALGPILVIVTTAIVVNFSSSMTWPFVDGSATDGLICAAVLAYALAHYRLQSLLSHLYPIDPRDREPASSEKWIASWRRRGRLCKHHRTPDMVTGAELVGAAWVLSACVIGAHLIWRFVSSDSGNPGLHPPIWRVVVVIWLIGGSGLVAYAVLTYLRIRGDTPEEAALYLQESAWQQTRREQRRLNRWLVWQRGRSRKENAK
jgi:hypothetical protein